MALLGSKAVLQPLVDRGFEEQRLTLKDQCVHGDHNV
jgi:hypothetical protein